MLVGVFKVAVGFLRDSQKKILVVVVIYNKTIQWHNFDLPSYN